MRRWLRNVVFRLLCWLRWLDRWLQRSGRRPAWARPAADPKRHAYAQPKPRWVRREVIKFKALWPQAGCRMIAVCFNRRFAVSRRMTVGKTYVADTLRREHYAILCARRKLKHAVPRRLPRNLVWGLDLAVQKDIHGRQHLILILVEHASRACLFLRRLPNKASVTLLACLIAPLRQYGRPQYLRTDNEGCWTSRLFRLTLWLLGTRHQRTTPHCPWENGRAERCIGTIKDHLRSWLITDLEDLDRALLAARAWYNHLRPHQHLQGRTPAEAWAGVEVFGDTPAGRTARRQWLRSMRQYARAVG